MKLEDSLGFLINKCARILKRDFDNVLSEYNLTTSQWAVLKLLNQMNRLTQVEISEKLYADKATTGEVIKVLLKKNMITRMPSPNDGRAYIISITDETDKLVKLLTDKAEFCNKKALNGFSKQDKEQITYYLKQMYANLEMED